jgi:hypothetical protein
MARFTTAGGSGDGTPGATGPQGPAGNDGAQGPQGDPGTDGLDALWNYTGEYNGGAAYAVGDIATYDGQLWYRYNSNGGNVGDTPSPGLWNLLAAKGANGADGTDGTNGADGAQGEQGIQGEPGLDADTAEETSFTVNGGTLGTQPTFDGAPLFIGSYVKTGPLVHFQIQVDMDNITNFGTGQYYVDLPFPAKYGYQVKQGCLHDDSSGRQYAIGGHVFAGQSTLALTFTNSAGQDEAFDHNSPVTLNVADNFHIAGTYITS